MFSSLIVYCKAQNFAIFAKNSTKIDEKLSFIFILFRYELKTREFHYEAHKNNDLLGSKNNWQSLMDYRLELQKASNNFQGMCTSATTS